MVVVLHGPGLSRLAFLERLLLQSVPSGVRAWNWPPRPSRSALIQFHMVSALAWKACQHMGSWVCMAGFMWSLPHVFQHWYARVAGLTTVPWAWAGDDQARAPTTTANSMTSTWRGR